MTHPVLSEPAQPADGHFVMIPLTRGKFAIVDEADAELVLDSGPWFAAPHNAGIWYAKTSKRGRPSQDGPKSMHTFIAGYKLADHVNRNGLDNRRINLRPATWSQNMANRRPLRNNKSGYKGVYWKRDMRKWTARITVNGHVSCLGFFDDPVDAARAYNQAAVEGFGEYAWLNPV